MLTSNYDPIAPMYDRYWDGWYLPAALPALKRLFFDQVAEHATVLDVCCGSGHVTEELVRRGYQVTGVDASEQLIEIARRKCPGTRFEVMDVRTMRLGERFDAALSTFDAFNHLMSADDVAAALMAVHRALCPGGIFLWDMNLDDAYQLSLARWTATVEDTSVGLVRGNYDSGSRMATTELIWFEKGPGDFWQRHASTVYERCYELDAILDATRLAGFREVEHIHATVAGMSEDVGYGRSFFRAIA